MRRGAGRLLLQPVDDERRIEGAALIIFERAAHRFDVGGVEPVAGDDVAAVAVIVTEVDRNLRRERVVCEAAAVDLAANLLEPVRPCGQPHLAAEIIGGARGDDVERARSEEHTSELQSLMRISYA